MPPADPQAHGRRRPWTLAGTLSAAAFIFDLNTPPGVAAAILYLLPIAVSARIPGVGPLRAFAAIGALLTILGALLSRETPVTEPSTIIANRLLTLFAIAALTLIGERWKRAQSRLEKMGRRLEARIADRTHALSEALGRTREEVRRRAEAQQALEDAKALSDRRADELAAANRELEEFAYAASHDLQEPLRTLTSYSTLLREDLGENLAAEPAEDLRFISEAADRMRRLIQDLLALSRTGRSPFAAEEVELGECVDEALEALRGSIAEKSAVLHVSPSLPGVRGDRRLLTQLFQNLLSNAVKFGRRGTPPEIHVSAERAESDWRISIRDNGIGIEPKYASQIFSPFKRLHGMSEYPGSGIGLAICRRAVERHGGRIWVESEPGRGATFKFTLPAKLPLPAGEQERPEAAGGDR